jgi:hypothetical protein
MFTHFLRRIPRRTRRTRFACAYDKTDSPAAPTAPHYRTWRIPPRHLRSADTTRAPRSPRASRTALLGTCAAHTAAAVSHFTTSQTAQPHRPPPAPGVRHGRRPGKFAPITPLHPLPPANPAEPAWHTHSGTHLAPGCRPPQPLSRPLAAHVARRHRVCPTRPPPRARDAGSGASQRAPAPWWPTSSDTCRLVVCSCAATAWAVASAPAPRDVAAHARVMLDQRKRPSLGADAVQLVGRVALKLEHVAGAHRLALRGEWWRGGLPRRSRGLLRRRWLFSSKKGLPLLLLAALEPRTTRSSRLSARPAAACPLSSWSSAALCRGRPFGRGILAANASVTRKPWRRAAGAARESITRGRPKVCEGRIASMIARFARPASNLF